MPILNYTTKISTHKTASEVQQILASHGAQAIMMEYSEGEVSNLSFRYDIQGTLLSFRLPVNASGTLKAIASECNEKRYINIEQAKRTAWRIVKSWVEAQMALVEAQQADMAQVFLPYLQDPAGNTLYEKLQGSEFKALEFKPG